MPALCEAIQGRNWTKARELLDGDAAAALAREKDEFGDLPLHWALEKGAPEGVVLAIIDAHPQVSTLKMANS